MNKLKVNLGRGFSILKKSNKLIGVKIKPGAKKLPAELSDRKIVYAHLAGFKIYRVGRSYRKVEAVLNKVRKHPNIQLGTHVYFMESSDKPVVPNGLIFVVFKGDSKKSNHNKLIKKLKLKKERTLTDTKVVLEVTKKSGNPLKICQDLLDSGLVAEAIPDFDVPMTAYDSALPQNDLFPLQWYLENNGAAMVLLLENLEGKLLKGLI